MVKVRAGESRIEGGYRLISVPQLCWVWAAYRNKRIGYRDLRVWFGAHEMSARRCQLKRGRMPRYTLAELQLLVGASVESLRSSLRSLQKTDCLSWRESSITFPAAPDDAAPERPEFHRMMGLITNNRRKVPVPRRSLRLIARSSRPATVATILGFLLRCLYQKAGQSFPGGCCKASWVGKVFGVDPRNVRRAKQNLVALGWLYPKDSDHWHRQRWGGKAVINLAWSEAPRDQSAASRSPYRRPDSAPQMPYPESHKKLLSEDPNSKPGVPGPGGVSAKRVRGGKGTGLRSLQRNDLANAHRLQALWVRACHARLVSASDADRLSFFAAAQRSLRVATRNPPGLFVTLVQRRLWSVISQRDEDLARTMLRTLTESELPPKVPPLAAVPTRCRSKPRSSSHPPISPERHAAIRNEILRSLASVGVDDLPLSQTHSTPIHLIAGGSSAQRRRVKVDRPAGGVPFGEGP